MKLTKYIQQRIICYSCGKYDRRVKTAKKLILCDFCGDPAELLEFCTGRGAVEVPWISRKFGNTENMNVGEQGFGRTPKRTLGGKEIAAPIAFDEVNELLERLQ